MSAYLPNAIFIPTYVHVRISIYLLSIHKSIGIYAYNLCLSFAYLFYTNRILSDENVLITDEDVSERALNVIKTCT